MATRSYGKAFGVERKRVTFSIDSSSDHCESSAVVARSTVDNGVVTEETGNKLHDDSGHWSEHSYDLAWERDKGSSRRSSPRDLGQESDHSLPLDDLHISIRGALSDSLQEDIDGIDDFANSSLDIDQLNISNEFLNYAAPDSLLHEQRQESLHSSSSKEDEIITCVSRKTPRDIITEYEAAKGKSWNEGGAHDHYNPRYTRKSTKLEFRSKEQATSLGDIIASVRMKCDDVNQESGETNSFKQQDD